MSIPGSPRVGRATVATPTRRAAAPDCPLLLTMAPRPLAARVRPAVLPVAAPLGSRPCGSREPPAHTSAAGFLTNRASHRIHRRYRLPPSQPSLLPPTLA